MKTLLIEDSWNRAPSGRISTTHLRVGGKRRTWLTPLHVVSLGTICFVGQLVTGTDLYVASMLTAAVIAGMLAVMVAEPSTAWGVLNGILLSKCVLIAVL